MPHKPDGEGPILPVDTLPDSEDEDLAIEPSVADLRIDTTVRTPARQDPTVPSAMYTAPDLDLTLDQDMPDVGEATLVGFTEQTVLEAVGPLEEELDWQDRLAELQGRLGRATTAAERVELLLEIGEIGWERLDDRAEAARAFEEVLELQPDNTRAFEVLDHIYYLEWETEKLAELLIDRAGYVESPSGQAALLARVAELYEHLNQPDKAVIALEAAHRADPDDDEIAAHLAELTQPPEPTLPKDQLELLAAQLELVQEAGDRIEILERMAGLYQQRQQPQRTAECLEQVLAIDPRRLACHRRLEQHYQQSGQLEPLVATLERHVQVAPPDERVAIHHRLAKLYERTLGDLERARAAYDAMCALDPDHGQALSAVARLSEQLQDWPAAARSLETLVEREANAAARVELYHRLATIQLDQLGDAESAESHLLRALELAPSHPICLSRLTEAYRARGDWGKVVRLLLQAEKASSSPLEQARLLHAAGAATLEGLGDEERAAALFQRTLEVDPDHAEAAGPLSEIYWQQGLHQENLPVLELLLRKADPDDRRSLVQIHFRLGAVAETLGQLEKAARHLGQATQLDPEHLPALMRLAQVAVKQRNWRPARALHERLTARRDELERRQLPGVLHSLGICLRELGDRDGAIEQLRQALELDPSHAPSVEALSELQQASSNWDAVVQLKSTQLEGASEEQQVQLLREMGEIQWRRLGQAEPAAASLRRALELRPEDHGLLHDLIDLFSELGQWESTVQCCDRMAELESDPRLRAKYYHTIAVIQRDRLEDPDRALDHFNRVLDIDPTQLAAFEAIDKLCTQGRSWKQLESNYARMIKRLPQEGEIPLKVMLWHNLGEVLRSRRRDFENAVAAFEVAARLDPDNLERHRILAELYVSLGGQYAVQAVAASHVLLRREPGRVEHYHRLRELYMAGGQYDRAWSLCMVLFFLKQADREEDGFYQQYRRNRLRRATSSLSDEIWRRQVHHPNQNPYVSAIFAQVTPALASMTARPQAHYGLKPKDRRDPARTDLSCLQLFDYVTAVLVVTRAELYLRPDRPEALLMAHTQNTPSFVAGSSLLQSKSERELAFTIGKQLTYLRPEHFLRNALPSKGQLQSVLLAVLKLCQPDFPLPEAHARAIVPIAERIQRYLPPGAREQLTTLVHRFCSGGSSQQEINISRWWNGLDLTSDRVGFVLCGDLAVAASMIGADSGGSELSPQERVNQLVQYACSEAYLNLRERLGLTIGE